MFLKRWFEAARRPRLHRSLQIILHGAARNAEHHRDLAATCSASGKPEHLS
jgi:hypothetical protein